VAFNGLDFSGFVNAFISDFMAWVYSALVLLVFLALGLLVADFVNKLLRTGLKRIRLEEEIAKRSFSGALGGFTVTQIATVFLKVYIVLAFLGQAAYIAGISFFTDLIWGLLGYLPNLAQGLIVLVGMLFVAAYVTKTIRDNRRIMLAKPVALGIHALFIYIAAVLALPLILPGLQPQINVLQRLIELLLTTAIVAVALAFGLGFGLGIKDAVAESASKHQEFFDDLVGKIDRRR